MPGETEGEYVGRNRRQRHLFNEINEVGSPERLLQIDAERRQRGRSTELGDAIRTIYDAENTVSSRSQMNRIFNRPRTPLLPSDQTGQDRATQLLSQIPGAEQSPVPRISAALGEGQLRQQGISTGAPFLDPDRVRAQSIGVPIGLYREADRFRGGVQGLITGGLEGAVAGFKEPFEQDPRELVKWVPPVDVMRAAEVVLKLPPGTLPSTGIDAQDVAVLIAGVLTDPLTYMTAGTVPALRMAVGSGSRQAFRDAARSSFTQAMRNSSKVVRRELAGSSPGRGTVGGASGRGEVIAGSVFGFVPGGGASGIDGFEAAKNTLTRFLRKTKSKRPQSQMEIMRARRAAAGDVIGGLQEAQQRGITGVEAARMARPQRGRQTSSIGRPELSDADMDTLMDFVNEATLRSRITPHEHPTAMIALDVAVSDLRTLYPGEVELLSRLFGDDVGRLLQRPTRSVKPGRTRPGGPRTTRVRLPESRIGPFVAKSRSRSRYADRKQRALREKTAARVEEAARARALAIDAASRTHLLEAVEPLLVAARWRVDRALTANIKRGAEASVRQLERMLEMADRQDIRAILAERRAAEKVAEIAGPTKTQTKALGAAQDAREKFLAASPNEEMLVQTAIDRLADVPEELQPALVNAIRVWYDDNLTLFNAIGPEGGGAYRQAWKTVQASATGQVADSYLTALLKRRAILADALRKGGAHPDEVARILDDLVAAEMHIRYGSSVAEIRSLRDSARRAITDVRPRVSDDEVARRTEALLEPALKGYGPSAVAQERRVSDLIDSAKGHTMEESLGFLSTLSQRAKNSTFGLLDIGILGQQVLHAIEYGGPAQLIGLVNRMLGAAHLWHVETVRSGIGLNRVQQFALDGVGQSAAPAAFRAETGSMLQYFGTLGRALDVPYIAGADRVTRLQYGGILTPLRNLNHEGNLVMAHLAGQDITNPVVRAQVAEFTNSVTSFAADAVRRRRAAAERTWLLSPQMTRAQINLDNLMIKGLTTGSPTERLLTATTILTRALSLVAIGKYLHDWIGVGDFEFDLSKPGAHLITLANGTVINLFPQTSYERAIARSVRAIAEADPQALKEAWLRYAMGRASIIGRIPGSVLGYGFEPGSGFRFGDMTEHGRRMNIAPIPPIVQTLALEGFDKDVLGFEAVGIPAFPESAYNLERRLVEPHLGKPIDQMTSVERREALQELGRLDEVDAKRVAEIDDLAARGDDTALFLRIGINVRNELLAISEAPGMTRILYKDLRDQVMDEARGARSQYPHVVDGWRESKIQAERDAARWHDLFARSTIPGTNRTDRDKFNELEGQLAAELGENRYTEALKIIHAIDPRDNEFEQERQSTLNAASDKGFWKLRNVAWAEFQRLHGEGALDDFGKGAKDQSDWWQRREAEVRELAEQKVAGGQDFDEAMLDAEREVSEYNTVSHFNVFFRTSISPSVRAPDEFTGTRHHWVRDNPDLARLLEIWGWFTPDKAERERLRKLAEQEDEQARSQDVARGDAP